MPVDRQDFARMERVVPSHRATDVTYLENPIAAALPQPHQPRTDFTD